MDVRDLAVGTRLGIGWVPAMGPGEGKNRHQSEKKNLDLNPGFITSCHETSGKSFHLWSLGPPSVKRDTKTCLTFTGQQTMAAHSPGPSLASLFSAQRVQVGFWASRKMLYPEPESPSVPELNELFPPRLDPRPSLHLPLGLQDLGQRSRKGELRPPAG